MKALLTLICFAAFTSILAGQPTPSQSPTLSESEVHFWAFLFSSIANPTEKPHELAIREALIVQKFGFNSNEAAALHTLAGEFYEAAATLRQKIDKIVEGKTSLSAGDQAALAAFDALQNRRIAEWANSLKSQLRPIVVARIERVIR